MDIHSHYSRHPRAGNAVLIASVIILLYALLGFYATPSILKKVLVSSIPEQLGRKVHMRRIAVNPFAISVKIEDFEMVDPGGQRFVGFEEFYVNFQLSSAFRRAFTFDEIRLIAPDIRIKVLQDGSLNFSDLLGTPNGAEPPPEKGGALPQVLIFDLLIERGSISFADLSRPTPYDALLFPIRIALENFSTRRDSESPYAFVAGTQHREVFSWEGTFSIDPIRSEGRFKLNDIKVRNLWKYMQDEVNFEVSDGTIGLDGQYTLAISGEEPHFRLAEGEFRLNELKLAEKGSTDTVLSLPAFSARDFVIDSKNRRVIIPFVESSDARFTLWLNPDGTLNYQKLFEFSGSEKEDKPATEPPNEEGIAGQPWVVTIEEISLDDYVTTFEDRTLSEPAHVLLKPININLKNVSTEKESQAEVAVNLEVNESGVVTTKGIVAMDPPFADLTLDISRVALSPFNPYVRSVAHLDILDGAFNLNGQARYQAPHDNEPMLRYEGDMSIDNFKAVSRVYTEDFVNWHMLAVNDLVLDIEPNKLSISEIYAKKPSGRVLIWPDGTLSLGTMFAGTGDEKIVEAQDKTETETGPQAAMPIAIGAIRIEDGSANFADLSLTPNFATGIQKLGGTITGLSSDALGRADVSLEGKVDEYAPVTISGQINPLSEDVYTDLEIRFDNIELTTFTPYSGRFAGYAIEKGKLSLDLKYKVSENVLIGDNKIVLNQFTLGERVDSPDAINLPIGLAIALLKDRNGIIDLDLPIRGNLDDPEFSYGHIIIQALLNIITKAVTSPFALIGGLVGADSETLSFVEFEFGGADLRTEETDKLDILAKALFERPMLRLEVKGAADTHHDRFALADVKLLNQLKRTKLEESGEQAKKDVGALEEIPLSDEDYNRLILQTYIETFGEDPRTLLEAEPGVSSDTSQTKPQAPTGDAGRRILTIGQQMFDNAQGLLGIRSEAYVKSKAVVREIGRSPESFRVLIERAKRRLIEDIPVDEIELRQLAQERANRIKGYLLEHGEIANERVFILDAEIDRISDGTALRLNLALSG